MARADSTIRVNILGDAKSLQRAASTSETAVGGLSKKIIAVGGVIAGAFVVDQLVTFGDAAVKEADRVADAAGRIEAQLGPELSRALIDRAEDFSRFGASEGDMLELEARLTDIGTAAGLSDEKLAPLAEDAAVLAAKMALVTDIPADEWIDKIGKALASGDFRVLKDLGINISDAAVAAQALKDTGKDLPEQLTETELATARTNLVMAELERLYGNVGEGSGDLEQKQAELNAKWETLTGEIGGPLTDLLEEVLDFVLRGIDGWQMLDAAVGGFDKAIRTALGPIARMIDAQRTLIDVLGEALDLLGQFAQFGVDIATGTGRGTPLPRGGLRAIQGQTSTTNVYVQGGSPETIEQAVRNAVRTAEARGPLIGGR